MFAAHNAAACSMNESTGRGDYDGARDKIVSCMYVEKQRYTCGTCLRMGLCGKKIAARRRKGGALVLFGLVSIFFISYNSIVSHGAARYPHHVRE